MDNFEFSIINGDIIDVNVDVVAFKYAKEFHGADRKVAVLLDGKGISLNKLRPEVGKYRFVSTNDGIAASYALFVGMPELFDIDYREIRNLSTQTMEIVAKEYPDVKSLAMTIHGPGFGLDEVESALSQFAGIYAFLRDTFLLPNLERVIIVD